MHHELHDDRKVDCFIQECDLSSWTMNVKWDDSVRELNLNAFSMHHELHDDRKVDCFIQECDLSSWTVNVKCDVFARREDDRRVGRFLLTCRLFGRFSREERTEKRRPFIPYGDVPWIVAS
jgi:hypothetical protein